MNGSSITNASPSRGASTSIAGTGTRRQVVPSSPGSVPNGASTISSFQSRRLKKYPPLTDCPPLNVAMTAS
jgi:hypothetical protein